MSYQTANITSEEIRGVDSDGAEIIAVKGRETLVVYTEAGYTNTQVDVLDLVQYLRKHRPELLIEQEDAPRD